MLKSTKKLVCFIGAGAVLATFPACLKTRAQLRGGHDPVHMEVQDVEPQGSSYMIDEIKLEITRLTGRIEELERAMASEREQQNKVRSEEDAQRETRIQELEKTQAAILETLKKLEEKIPKPDPISDFKRGKSAFNAKKYSEAIQRFTTYLASGDTNHQQLATFLRAEAYFHSKDYKKAIIDYSKFPEKFTRSIRMPESLYKIGLSFEALGMKDDAKAFYQELLDKFPKSEQAKKSRAKIAPAR